MSGGFCLSHCLNYVYSGTITPYTIVIFKILEVMKYVFFVGLDLLLYPFLILLYICRQTFTKARQLTF